PRGFAKFDGYIRNYLTKRLDRGKIDIFVNFEEDSDYQYEVIYNEHLAKMYYDKLQEMAKEFDIDGTISAASLSRYNEVLELKEIEESYDDIESMLEKALTSACDEFIENRISEGERLKTDLLDKLDNLSKCVDFIEEKSPLIISEYKEKLTSKIQNLLEDNNIDDNRIAMEVTIMADKICVDEEIVRLKSHIKEVKDAFNGDDAVGRKLDFVAQELNREANTILSKSTNVDIANTGIEMKTLIEKIREQIQNIE
nr:YicC family protein [Lachnospiraceae bacterium]